MKKLRSKKGETLIETLTALLVATFVVLFLTTSIVVAARINKKIKDTDTSLRYDNAAVSDSYSVTVTQDNGTGVGSVAVKEYTDESGYYRYYKGVSGNG